MSSWDPHAMATSYIANAHKAMACDLRHRQNESRRRPRQCRLLCSMAICSNHTCCIGTTDRFVRGLYIQRAQDADTVNTSEGGYGISPGCTPVPSGISSGVVDRPGLWRYLGRSEAGSGAQLTGRPNLVASRPEDGFVRDIPLQPDRSRTDGAGRPSSTVWPVPGKVQRDHVGTGRCGRCADGCRMCLLWSSGAASCRHMRRVLCVGGGDLRLAVATTGRQYAP